MYIAERTFSLPPVLYHSVGHFLLAQVKLKAADGGGGGPNVGAEECHCRSVYRRAPLEVPLVLPIHFILLLFKPPRSLFTLRPFRLSFSSILLCLQSPPPDALPRLSGGLIF